MTGFGFGFGARFAGYGIGSPVQPGNGGGNGNGLVPHSSWDGTAGSGFGAIPQDPVRETAKPVLRLITPPWQWFAEGETEVVGVAAAANDGDNLLATLGIERVIAHYEGAKVDILAPTYRTIIDANGTSRSYLGWWLELENDGRFGAAHLYFEAVPHDATMQRRVIGPYLYRPMEAKYSHTLEVAATPSEIPGQRYKTLAGAMTYLQGLPAPINPLVTITESVTDGEFVGYQFGYNRSNHVEGWIHLTATVPVTFDKSGTASSFAPIANGIHAFGANLTFDFHTMNELSQSGGWPGHGHWLDGINLTNSNGAFDLFEKRTRNLLGFLVRGIGDEKAPWFTECSISNVWNSCVYANLCRGNTLKDCWSDLFNLAGAVVANTVEDWLYAGYRDLLPAMTVSYTGSEASASIEVAGRTLGSRTVIARWGANSESFSIDVGSTAFVADTNYSISNIVDWINSTLANLDAGWSATLLDDSRLASAIVKNEPTDLVSAFPQTNVKNTTLTLHTAFDIHGDWYQQLNTTEVVENRYIEGNRMWNGEGQGIFLGGTQDMHDTIIINNAWAFTAYSADTGIASQVGRIQKHFVYMHNTLANQRLLPGGTVPPSFDTYSSISNNALTEFAWVGTPDSDLNMDNNHVWTGGDIATHAVNTTIGGDMASLFADALNGDFTPQGDLLTFTKQPAVANDLTGQERWPLDAVGALRAASEPVLAAPTLFDVSVDGQASGGELLNVTWVVTGNPTPTVTLQWKLNGVDIAGETSAILLVDVAELGLVNGDVLSCVVTASNSLGSEVEEASASYLEPSLVSVDDFGNASQFAEKISSSSFRFIRSGSGNGSFFFYLPSTGSFTLTGIASGYDGAEPGYDTLRFPILNNAFQPYATLTAANIGPDGSFSVRIEASNTLVRLGNNGTVGQGVRVDNFRVVSG